jgi:putative hydrolase
MAELTGTGLDTDAERGLLMGKPAGVQAGAMLAFLSTAILGQYDPFTGPDGTLLLVAPNIMAVERALGVSPTDFRFWVCLHEVTHRVQFSSAPWLAEYMRANVDTLGAVGDEPIADMLARLLTEVRGRRSGATDDPNARGVVGLLRATQAPPLRALLGVDAKVAQYVRGKAFVDHVVDRVGMVEFNAVWTDAQTLPRTDEIDEPQRWISRVLG